ncbi:acyl-CoA carboxylase subunit epsilon [Actinomycetota bacterium Odt1-20B]
MDKSADTPLVRIDKGGARPEELAAVTALLMARAAAARPPAATRSRTPRAGWRRLERVRGYRTPLSWQS